MGDPCWLVDRTTKVKHLKITSEATERERERPSKHTGNPADLHTLQVTANVLLLTKHTHIHKFPTVVDKMLKSRSETHTRIHWYPPFAGTESKTAK